MAVLNKKKKISAKSEQITFCVIMYTILALFIVILFIFNCNYSKIYKSPQIKDGKADFSNVDIPSRDVACNLAGQWEFFYNKWIVTDGYDGERDGLINISELWTYKNFGNGRLTKTGYASYRLIVQNVQPDIDIKVYRLYCNFAYRVFINGQLNYRSGELSKNVSETKVTGISDEIHPYHTDGGDLEIVIEISAMNTGGFNTAPWLAASTTGKSYGSNLRSFNYIALGLTTSAVAISILTYAFFKYKRDITAPAFMIALYCHFLFSKDMLYVIPLSIPAAMILQLLSATATLGILIAHFWRNGAKLNKIFVIVTSAAVVLFTALTFAFYGTPLAAVFAFILFGIGCSYLVPMVFNNKSETIQWSVYGTLFVFLMSVLCFEMCDGLGLLVFGTEFIFTFELMIILTCFALLWIWKLAKTARTAIRASQLECELAAVKNQALKAQIKPHFIYNSLTAIQAQYRDGLDEGDKAIEQFAKHLRLITDSNSKDTIPFDDEVRNVLNYFELENLRTKGKLNLLLDLNYTDFCVPILSLQPLVENAIRHSGIRQKQDGYIELSSDKRNNCVIIKVSDNGNGFDVTATRSGVGLENTQKRFELLKAQMEIYSKPNCGTQVIIKIPLE